MGIRNWMYLVSLTGIMAIVSVPCAASAQAEQDVMQRVDELQKQVDEQQKTIDELSAEKDILGLSQHIDNMSVTGDMRVRYERRDLDLAVGGDEILERMRARFRLGLIWKSSSENWEVGAGLTTGGEEGTSAYDTWGEDYYFETGDIRLDYAYGRHTLGPFKLTAGQQKNPFETSWLLWDSDLRPTGFTAQYDGAILLATAGGYDIKQYVLANGNTDFGMLYAGQAGVDIDTDVIDITLTGSIYDFDGVFDKNERPNPDYEYLIGDIYGSGGFSLAGVGMSLYFQTFYNFGADGNAGESILGGNLDPEDENMGWVVGLTAKIAILSAEYAYAQVGADSCVGALKDASFGSGLSPTDIKGHKVSAYVSLPKNFFVGGNVLLYEALERSNEDEVTLYQADMTYKF